MAMTAEGEASQRVSALKFASQAAGVTGAAIGGLGHLGDNSCSATGQGAWAFSLLNRVFAS